MECESRLLIEVCGCILYFMPPVDENTIICGQDKYMCYSKITLAIDLAKNSTFECNCLPGCFEISYRAEVSAVKLGTDGFSVRQNFISRANPDFVKYILFNLLH